MKHKLSSLFLGLSLMIGSLGLCSYTFAEANETEIAGRSQVGTQHKEQAKSQEQVYVCYGPRAYAYHKNRHCSGLKRCSVCVETITIEQALKEKRTPCRKCYSKKK